MYSFVYNVGQYVHHIHVCVNVYKLSKQLDSLHSCSVVKFVYKVVKYVHCILHVCVDQYYHAITHLQNL